MIIKPLKDQFVSAIFLSVFSITVCPIIILIFNPDLSECRDMILICTALGWPLPLVAARNWIAYCTTIIMDENGCTVKRFGIKKRYLWSELQTKCVEDHDMRNCTSRPAFYKCVIFSKRKNFHTPESIHITGYLAFFCLNPLKFFYVGFMYNPNPKNNEIDEKLFFEKMNEWGIELQEYRNFKFSPYKNYVGKTNEAEASQETEETNKLN